MSDKIGILFLGTPVEIFSFDYMKERLLEYNSQKGIVREFLRESKENAKNHIFKYALVADVSNGSYKIIGIPYEAFPYEVCGGDEEAFRKCEYEYIHRLDVTHELQEAVIFIDDIIPEEASLFFSGIYEKNPYKILSHRLPTKGYSLVDKFEKYLKQQKAITPRLSRDKIAIKFITEELKYKDFDEFVLKTIFPKKKNEQIVYDLAVEGLKEIYDYFDIIKK